MNPTFKAICFTVAVVLFVIDAWLRNDGRPPLGLQSLGLAFFVFPFCWDAWEAA